MALDETIQENDKVFEVEGIPFVVRNDLMIYIQGLHVNYTNSWLGKGFQLHYA
jgi:Fe-S cluster assembly iron-binding protein IscA